MGEETDFDTSVPFSPGLSLSPPPQTDEAASNSSSPPLLLFFPRRDHFKHKHPGEISGVWFFTPTTEKNVGIRRALNIVKSALIRYMYAKCLILSNPISHDT